MNELKIYIYCVYKKYKYNYNNIILCIFQNISKICIRYKIKICVCIYKKIINVILCVEYDQIHFINICDVYNNNNNNLIAHVKY